MKTRYIWVTILLLLALSSALVAAAVPDSIEKIPLYKGAERDYDAEDEIMEHYAEYGSEYEQIYEVRVYKVKAIIDDVCKFYIDKLGAKPGTLPDDVYEILEPGEVYAPWYEVEFYGDKIFEDQYEYTTLIQDGKWIRSAFEKRPQWEKGKWLSQVWFEWYIMLDSGDLATYSVYLIDEGYDWKNKIDYRSTQIRIDVTITTSEDDFDDEWGFAEDEDFAFASQYFAKNPPTEETLGIPFYPGWIYSPELSAGMSQDDYHYYVFFSSDPPDKVAAFYTQRLNMKPAIMNEFYIFALKGELPVPEEGLVIQPNLALGDMPQTIITVQKKI
ncbi:MAG: hypothetical protein ACOX8I_10860 [Bacillota bacterium]|jgi:hypothetical protein